MTLLRLARKLVEKYGVQEAVLRTTNRADFYRAVADGYLEATRYGNFTASFRAFYWRQISHLCATRFNAHLLG